MGKCLLEPKRGAVGFEERIGLLPDVRFEPPQRDDLAHRLGVIAGRLGFGVDVLDVVGDALFLFLKAFDPLDEQTKLLGCDIVFGPIIVSPNLVEIFVRAAS